MPGFTHAELLEITERVNEAAAAQRLRPWLLRYLAVYEIRRPLRRSESESQPLDADLGPMFAHWSPTVDELPPFAASPAWSESFF